MSDTSSSEQTRPLLQNNVDASSTSSQENVGLEDQAARNMKQTPLPQVQLGILCLLRTLDPMCYNQIFPYINQFMADLRVTDDPSQIGFYSGLVESVFAFTQLLAIYPWGVLSDRYGRRRIVLVGVAGLAVTTALFGLSRSFLEVMVMRALAGLASGNVPVIPSILIEITDSTNQHVAFPFFGFWWPVGAIIGPLLGGLLSHPAERYPRYFNHPFFQEFPYFLPGFLISIFSVFSFVVAYFFLKETMNVQSPGTQKPPTSYGSTGIGELPSKTFSMKELWNIPIIRVLCASGCALSFISCAFDVLFVLFCYSPILSGGLAFSPAEIGFALSVSGFVAALLQVFIMPPILQRVDHAVMYHFCMKLWPYVFMFLPVLNVIARKGLNRGSGELEPRTTVVLWIGIALILSLARVAFLAYSVNMLIVKRFAPNSASLGSTTGLIQFSICFARAFSPAFASSVFAFSSNKQILGGYLWVVIMTLIGFTSSKFSEKVVIESSR